MTPLKIAADATLETKLALIIDALDRLLNLIEGNGKKGLADRTDCLETDVAAIKTQHDEEKAAKQKAEDRQKKNQDQIMIGILFLILTNIIMIITR